MMREAFALAKHELGNKKKFQKIVDLREELLRNNSAIAVNDFEENTANIIKKGVRFICRNNSKSHKQGKLLHYLVHCSMPAVCAELGTSLGISTAYLAKGLYNFNSGKLYSIEGSKETSEYAKKNLERVGIKNAEIIQGKFENVLPGLLNNISPIDFVFIDGHHDGKATEAYFEMLLPHLSKKALIVFDDIRWSADMYVSWERIIKSPDVSEAVDLYRMGVVRTNGNN
jgi:predicted O-methyltransferase YrrM